MLLIAVNDETRNGVAGKQFDFKCGMCEYCYSTEVITKPKSLLNIIKEEYNTNNSFHDAFLALRTLYQDKLHHEALNEQMVKDLNHGKKYKGVPLDVIQKLKQFNVSAPLDESINDLDKLKLKLESNSPITLDEEEDAAEVSRRMSRMLTSVDSNLDIFKATMLRTQLVPIPKQLTSRNTLKCCDCNHDLLVPSDELLSTKFLTKWNANEYLPSLTISPLINHKFPESFESGKLYFMLMNIVNPLPFLATLNISIPSEFGGGSDFSVQATIAESSIKVGGYNSKDHPIRAIPTPYLTQNTKVSRAELIMRLGKINSNNNHDVSVDVMESLVEKSDNWYLVPLELTLQSLVPKRIDDLKIPVFATVNSRIPEIMKQLGLSKGELSFGYWTIIDLGSISVL